MQVESYLPALTKKIFWRFSIRKGGFYARYRRDFQAEMPTTIQTRFFRQNGKWQNFHHPLIVTQSLARKVVRHSMGNSSEVGSASRLFRGRLQPERPHFRTGFGESHSQRSFVVLSSTFVGCSDYKSWLVTRGHFELFRLDLSEIKAALHILTFGLDQAHPSFNFYPKQTGRMPELELFFA